MTIKLDHNYNNNNNEDNDDNYDSDGKPTWLEILF